MAGKQPTVAESAWMDRVARMGCVCCRIHTGAHVPAEIHHMTAGGRRLGHMFVLPLCEWHHRKQLKNGMPEQYMLQIAGPTVEHGRKVFEAFWGDEEDLLKQVCKWLGSTNTTDISESASTSSDNSTT